MISLSSNVAFIFSPISPKTHSNVDCTFEVLRTENQILPNVIILKLHVILIQLLQQNSMFARQNLMTRVHFIIIIMVTMTKSFLCRKLDIVSKSYPCMDNFKSSRSILLQKRRQIRSCEINIKNTMIVCL